MPDAMQQAVISVSSLGFAYQGKTILDNVSLSIHPGQVTVILGGSGCGKSTLLKNMLGFLTPKTGTIEYFGETWRGKRKMEKLLQRFGIVFQHGALIGSMTVAENVALPLLIHTAFKEDLRDKLVDIALRRVSMSHAKDLYPSELSGGMRKRAAIARAIILDPEILFFDEPAAGLDPVTAVGLDNLILELKASGKTLIVVSHELESIKTIADKVVMLHDGTVLFEGDLSDALASPEPLISDFFARRLPLAVGQDREAQHR